MNKTLVALLVGLAVAGLAFGALSGLRQDVVREVRTVVGSAGSVFSFPVDFLEGAFLSSKKDLDGDVLDQTTSGSTVTLTAAQVCENTLINQGFTTATGTVTLPTVASLIVPGNCFSREGDVVEFAIRNASSTSRMIFAVGASSTLNFVGTATSTLQERFMNFKGVRNTSSSQIWIDWFGFGATTANS